MVAITGRGPFLCCMPVQSREGKVEGNNGTSKTSSTPTSIVKEKSKAERKRVSGRCWHVCGETSTCVVLPGEVC